MKFLVLLAVLFGLGCKTAESVDNLTNEVNAEDLLYLYEEEKVARDVYDYFESLYGIMPFIHISDAEQSHFETLEALVLSLGIITEDEVIRNEAGVFNNAELQGFYNDFTERGDASLIKALNVSAFVEEHDITGLLAMFESTGNTEVRETLELLINASHNHLRAFNRNLEMRDVDYEPVLLDERYFNDVINGRSASCGNDKGKTASCCQGKSHGQKAACNGEGKQGKGQCRH